MREVSEQDEKERDTPAEPMPGPRPDVSREAEPERDDTAIEPEPPKPEPPKPEPVKEEQGKQERPPEPEQKGPNGDTGIKAKPKSKPKPKAKAKAKAKPAKPKSMSEKLAEAGERNREMEKAAAAKRKAEGDSKMSKAKPASGDMLLAHRATALAMGGSVKDGVLTIPAKDDPKYRKFGAPVNAGQVKLIADQVKGKNILQWLGCKEAELRRYATGESKVTDLPEETRKRLKDLNGKFESRLKMWPRKDATILYVLQQERKKGSKPKPKAPAKAAA